MARFKSLKPSMKFPPQVITQEREFKIILPKRDNDNRKIDPSAYTEFIGAINKRFGGSTTVPSVFGFFKHKGKLQGEENFVVTVARDFDKKPLNKLTPVQREKLITQDRSFMKRLANKAGKKFGQTSIFVQEARVDSDEIKGKRKKTVPAVLGERLFEKAL